MRPRYCFGRGRPSRSERINHSAAHLARNTKAIFLAQLVQGVIQAAYFVLLARGLGVAGYGTFVAVLALASILAPFAMWGAADVLVQEVSLNRRAFPEAWGTALATTFLMGAVATLAMITIGRWVLPGDVSRFMIALICLAEFWFSALVYLGGKAYQAFEMLGRTGLAWLCLSACKFAGVVAMTMTVDTPTALNWAGFYFAATAVAALAVSLSISCEIGLPVVVTMQSASFRVGFHFALGASATNVTSDVDKTMLARMRTVTESGVYSAAYRAVEMSMLPVMSLLHSSYPAFFRHGAHGITRSLRLARKLALPTVTYSVIAGLMLFAAAPLIPWVLGEEYREAVPVLRMLSILPAIRTVYFLVANALTGAGHQPLRGRMQAAAAVLNILLNLILIPQMGIGGAILATLITEAGLAGTLSIAALQIQRRRRRMID